MSKPVILLEDSYPDRETMKRLLESRGRKVLNIKEMVDHLQKIQGTKRGKKSTKS